MEEDKEERTLAAILAAADLKGCRILEIGCGDGRVTAMLAGIPQRLVAVDPDAGRIKMARHRVADAVFAAASGENLPFETESFDTVLFTLSLHHQNSARALEEAGRVLEPGGCIVAVEPEPEGEIERICCLVEDESPQLVHAAAAVADTPFSLACDDRFRTRWVFDDRTELLNWLFSYYNRPYEREVALKVDQFLGSRTAHRPLVLHDDLHIIKLEKESHHDR
ncbi:MAG: class I SAM-dependent methyltransferase [Desulfobacterales bacterium]|nr:class I SAM-dependent methyltransferase [Desulfobacterales bacterium]